jgi:hypothetical protein
MSLFRRNAHLADAKLLLLLEGDLRGRTLRRAEQHLSVCSDCRMRRHVLMEANVQVRSDLSIPVTAPASAARERLALGLEQQAQAAELRGFARVRQWPVFWPSVLLRTAIVTALIAVAFVWRQLDLPLQDLMAAYEETGPKPNRILTPGSATPATLNDLCSLSDFDLDPSVSPAVQRAVFRAYGLTERAARNYQVDYLINPQLGGNDRLENLWPEPYHATVWNARAKDALEARLHGMVCSGQVDLRAAQQDLSTDWIAAYKKYFHTQRPISTVAELDRPPAAPDRLP